MGSSGWRELLQSKSIFELTQLIKKNHSAQGIRKIISGNRNSMKTCKDLGFLGLDPESNASKCQALFAL